MTLEDLTDCFRTYSSVEASSIYRQVTSNRGGEGDYVALPDGSIIMAYNGYGATSGDYAPCELFGVLSTDGGITWSEPWIILSNAAGAVNVNKPKLFWLGDRTLGLVYVQIESEGKSNVYFRRSYDLGKNWEDPVRITEMYSEFFNIMTSGNAVLRLDSGRILVATTVSEYESDIRNKAHRAVVWYSDDEGASWQRTDGTVVLANTVLEACIAPLDNGDLLMTMRTRREGKIYQTISCDQGNTWAQPVAVENMVTPSSPNLVASIPATGDILLIWNNEFATDNGTRNPVTSAVSSDHGLTYKNIRNVFENGSSWPVVRFFGRRAFIQLGATTFLRVADVEEFYYAISGEVTLADLPKALTPTASYDRASGWMTGVSSSMTYSLDGGASWRFCGGSSVLVGEVTGEILVRDIGNGSFAPSDVQILPNV